MAALLLALSLASLAPDGFLDRWLAAWRRGTEVEEQHVVAFESRLEAARAAAGQDEAARRDVRAAALDAVACSGVTGEVGPPTEAHERLHRAGRAVLRADRGARDWMLTEVVPLDRHHDLARRRAALEVLVRDRVPELATALLVVARRRADPLRPRALEVLAGWAARMRPDEAVDRFLVTLLATEPDPRARPHPFNLLQLRIQGSDAPLGERASEDLRERLAVMLLSQDWRQAARAVQLARGLSSERRVPLLLDALSAWARREGRGRGSRRIQGDLVAELQRISGRTIGTNPRNWITWWVAVRQGRIELPEEGRRVVPGGGGAEALSRTGFFGLRPTTDRVTFIVDHSGSMAQRWNTEDHTRYDEAIEQMTRFLQASGPETYFNVILFDGEVERSSRSLVAATPENLERARRSMQARPPDGGTHLRPAVELAVGLDSRGELDPSALDADTVVVLCDGATQEGAAWVGPFLDRVVGPTQVVFHCVLIGASGDGALAALARGTGGEFVRVGG